MSLIEKYASLYPTLDTDCFVETIKQPKTKRIDLKLDSDAASITLAQFSPMTAYLLDHYDLSNYRRKYKNILLLTNVEIPLDMLIAVREVAQDV